MSDPIQAIVRRSITIAATFTGIPSPEDRKALKAAGAEFKNGQWVRTESESVIIDGSEVAKVFAEGRK
jgi:hypothetical protein